MNKLGKTDEQILIESLRLINKSILNDQIDKNLIQIDASKIKKGWSWINCYQWLSGAKSLEALSKVSEDYLIKNLGFDKQHALGLIYAASAMCNELNISQGGNYEKLTKLFDDKLNENINAN